MKHGQVIGATDRLVEATERPVHFMEVLATLYHHVGIDVAAATLPDLSVVLSSSLTATARFTS